MATHTLGVHRAPVQDSWLWIPRDFEMRWLWVASDPVPKTLLQILGQKSRDSGGIQRSCHLPASSRPSWPVELNWALQALTTVQTGLWDQDPLGTLTSSSHRVKEAGFPPISLVGEREKEGGEREQQAWHRR